MRKLHLLSAALAAPIMSAFAAAIFAALQLALQIALPAPAYAVDPPQVKVGGDVRLRGYYLDNFLDFDDAQRSDEWSVFRLRTRVSVSAAMENGVSAYVRIGNQHYSEGVTAVPSADGDRWEEENKSNKFFVDAAYIDVKDLFGLPLELFSRAPEPHVRIGLGDRRRPVAVRIDVDLHRRDQARMEDGHQRRARCALLQGRGEKARRDDTRRHHVRRAVSHVEGAAPRRPAGGIRSRPLRPDDPERGLHGGREVLQPVRIRDRLLGRRRLADRQGETQGRPERVRREARPRVYVQDRSGRRGSTEGSSA